MPTLPAALAAILFALAALAGGCSSRPAAEVALARQPEEPVLTGTMTSAQQREIEGGFESLADGRTAVSRPVVAPLGGRWSDVYPAVVEACDEIEAAVVSKKLYDWGWEIHIRTVEEWPGTLTIRRAMPESKEISIYEATAVIGLYGDRTERAEALLKAFHERLRAFGRKRSLPDDETESD